MYYMYRVKNLNVSLRADELSSEQIRTLHDGIEYVCTTMGICTRSELYDLVESRVMVEGDLIPETLRAIKNYLGETDG